MSDETFFQEFYKTFVKKSFVFLMLVTLILNCCLLWTKNTKDGVEAEAYHKAYDYIGTLAEEERVAFILEYAESLQAEGTDQEIRFTGDVVFEKILMAELKKQALQIKNYPDYLEQIQSQAELSEISIFEDVSEFSKKNLKETAKAFQSLQGISLSFNNSFAFQEATGFQITDIFVIIILLYVVNSLVITEKEKGLFALFRSTKNGRMHLILQKLLVVTIASLVLVMIFWGCNYVTACMKYGEVDLRTPLQTISGYDGSALPLTVLQYLLLFYFCKFVMYTAIGYFFVWVALKIQYTTNLYLYSLLVLVVEIFFYYAIDGGSGLQILHYLNLIPLVNVNAVFRFYFNLNLFGIPVNLILLSAAAGVIFLLLFGGLCIHLFSSDRWNGTVRYRQSGRKKKVHIPTPNLLSHEIYRLLIGHHGLALILLLVFMEIWMYSQRTSLLGTDEYFYKSYMQEIEGTVTSETELYLNREQERIKKYEMMMEDARTRYQNGEITAEEAAAVNMLADKNLRSRNGFQRVIEQYQYAEENDVPMVYDTGYGNLFGFGTDGYKKDCSQALVMILFLVLLFAEYNCIEYETGMIRLICTLPNGRRKLFGTKFAVCFVCTVIVFIISYVPELIYVANNFGMSEVSAPLKSIPAMQGNVLEEVTIGQYLLILYLIRFMMTVLTLILVMKISEWRKNMIQVTAIVLCVLALPLLIHILGIQVVDHCSLNAFFSGNMLLRK